MQENTHTADQSRRSQSLAANPSLSRKEGLFGGFRELGFRV